MFDVAIVGLGPVGALLANLLGQAGLQVIALERDTGIHPLPRAVHFDGEVMRIFQSAGLADRIAAAARPSSKGMHFLSPDGRTLMIRRGREGPGPQGWVSNWYFHQPLLEQVLRDGLGRFPNVQCRLGTEVVALDETKDHVTLHLQPDAGPVQAHYVVGCDGARSLVRRAIGSRQQDLGLHQPWLVVDLLVDQNSKRARELPDFTIQLCDPMRPMTVVYVGGDRHRWEIMLMPGDDPARMTEPEIFWPMLARWLGPEDAVIERSAVYTFHSVIAEGWRRDRLLLAGDSCHQTPPFLGQGMCAGMRDAANLAWKLDLICRGLADDALLDTYESERRPHVQTFIDLAVKLGAVIQATDPEAARERDRRFASGAPEMFDYPQPALGPGAHRDGRLFPQPRLADGRLLDEAVGNRFAVLGRASSPPGMVAIEKPGPEISAWLTARDAIAVVLRPDRYIFGVARDQEALAKLTRALPSAPKSTVT
ncbi:bifunctional 3-(3-hydroxy-phenyl)propionate/3-hydroxycinnamic acid hydroxylase MhpA [Desertibaculum subflavum]|uniref:bifunctional 3-(3-hydroxy-phenyl)propionate/3-hydroxycinnamic acid hydroxylase MhpA n=1 Tax=Desertibaculum subflavum TaxID=2268458 RepID=UPI000E668E55